MAKFSQNPDLKVFILQTDDGVLVEASPYDKIWGIEMKRTDIKRRILANGAARTCSASA